MSATGILTATVIVGVVGIFVGLFLGVAGIKFRVEVDEKEINRKHLAASAGFMKFCPRPPNSIFTTRMANTPPTTPIHQGADAGRFSASSSPVTTAE